MHNTREDTNEHHRAFTLLELVVVLAIVSLLATLSITSLRPASPAKLEHVALKHIANELATARANAMRRAHPISIDVRQDEAPLNRPPSPITLAVAEQQRTVPDAALRLVDARADAIDHARVTFDPTGRTNTRVLRLLSERAGSRSPIDLRLLADPAFDPDPAVIPDRAHADAPRDGRVWLIDFDPVSGAPSLRAHGPGLPPHLESPNNTR